VCSCDTSPVVAPRLRSPLSYAAVAGGLAVVVLTVATRRVTAPNLGTSLWVLGFMVAVVAVLVRTYLRLGQGWVTWRRAVAGLIFTSLAYPALWAAAALTAEGDPSGFVTWLAGSVAGVGHIPQLVALSVLPILTARYLGRGATRAVVMVVAAVAVVNAALLIAFTEPYGPGATSALVGWGPGRLLSEVVNTLFLATTLLGSAVAVRAARAADGEARRRLVLVAVTALTGPALVLMCSVLGFVATEGGNEDGPLVVLLCGMYVAVAIVTLGASRALRTPYSMDTRQLSRIAAGLVALIVALATVTFVVSLDLHGTWAALVAASVAVALTLAFRPVESWVTRIILAPVFEHAGVDGLESGTVVAGTGLTCLEPLTQRESEVLSLLAEGLSNAGIAARLVLSKKTVEAHLRSVFRKLELPESPLDNRRVHAVRAWYLAEQGIRQAS
jgi:hypothetical protein